MSIKATDGLTCVNACAVTLYTDHCGVYLYVRSIRDTDDAEIVAALRERRPAAIEALMERFTPLVSGIAGSVLSSPEDVAEVCQDVFMKASEAAATFDPRRASLATWLGRIAYNTALNAARANRRRPPTMSLDGETSPQIADELPDEPDPRVELLQHAIDGLSPPDRTLIHLVYYADMPLAEVAAVLRTNRLALAMRLMRLRRRLAMIIQTHSNSSSI